MQKILYLCITICMAMTSCHRNELIKSEQNRANEISPQNKDIILKDATLAHDEKFRVVTVQTSIESFESKGFKLGDSIDAVFNTGFELKDIPYFNGFYIKQGEAMIVGYPGCNYLYLGYNDADDIWNLAKLDENSTVTIKLREKAKYLSIQNTFNLVYSDDRNDFASDIEFANYRAMRGGRIRPNVFYRSASPIDNRHNRAPYVDALMKHDNIQYVLDFSDNEQKIAAHLAVPNFQSPYFKELYENGRVSLLDLSSNFRLPEFKQKVAESLTRMIQFDGPYLAHCVEGKDRTGFISILMEGLCEASYDEMKDDYMKTYEIYYGVTKTNRSESYHAISELLFDEMLSSLSGEKQKENLEKAHYSEFVKNYLQQGGMTPENMDILVHKICADE